MPRFMVNTSPAMTMATKRCRRKKIGGFRAWAHTGNLYIDDYSESRIDSFSYDANGNMVVRDDVDGRFAQAFDVENRLTHVADRDDATFSDRFDTLPTSNWTMSANVAGVNGVIEATGQNNWATGFNRSVHVLDDGTSIEMHFKLSDNTNGLGHMGIRKGSWNTSSFGRIALFYQSGNFYVEEYDGPTRTLSPVILEGYEVDTWYVLNIFVDDDGGMVLDVHEWDNPENGATYRSTDLDTGESWRFYSQPHTGVLTFDNYSEQPANRFLYDANGIRTITIDDTGMDTHFPFPDYAVDDPGGAGETERVTYFFWAQAVATRVDGTLSYLHTDHLGSTSLATTIGGAELSGSRASYLPFGEEREVGTADLDGRGFTGHRENDYINLVYMNARWYSPYIYRFLSADTIVPDQSDSQAYNRYSYTRNAPINRVDPSGHSDCLQVCFDGGASAFISSPGHWYNVEGYGAFDMAHIERGYDAYFEIMSQIYMAQGNPNGGEVFLDEYKEFGSYTRSYWVAGNLTDEEFLGVALGIYMDFELGFEEFQATAWGDGTFSPGVDLGNLISSFGVEDLPSDYVGFWAAANGYGRGELVSALEILGEVDVRRLPPIALGAYVDADGQLSDSGFPRNHRFNPTVYACCVSSPSWPGIMIPAYVPVPWPEELQMTPLPEGGRWSVRPQT